MNWILTNYWIWLPLAAIAAGGMLFLTGYFNKRQKKDHPLPKRHIVSGKKQSKDSSQPLLIRLPKLGV